MTLLSRTSVPGTSFRLQPTATTADISQTARSFSQITDPKTIKEICMRSVPSWSVLASEDLEVFQVLAGLSNQLFKVTVKSSAAARTQKSTEDAKIAEKCEDSNPGKSSDSQNSSPSPTSVLFRIYGKEIASLYDPKEEVAVFSVLSKERIAPHLIAVFEGGRIEEWIEGAPLTIYEMALPHILSGFVKALAQLHTTQLPALKTTENSLWRRLHQWKQNAMTIFERLSSDHPSFMQLQQLHLPRLAEESELLPDLLTKSSRKAGMLATELCFCHNDIQENNIMVLPNGGNLRLIDFEFSGCGCAAFDFASYFWEMTCDYCWPSYPYFFTDPLLYPPEATRRRILAKYLSLRLERVVAVDEEIVSTAVYDVERFLLVAHMLWCFWAVIRAPQAATVANFDMLHYALKRADGYWTQKARLIDDNILPREDLPFFPREIPNGVEL